MNRAVVMHAKSNLNIDLYKSRKNIFDTPLCTLPPHAHGHTNTGIHHKKYLKDIDRINKTTLLKCVKPFDLIDFVEHLYIKHNMYVITILRYHISYEIFFYFIYLYYDDYGVIHIKVRKMHMEICNLQKPICVKIYYVMI